MKRVQAWEIAIGKQFIWQDSKYTVIDHPENTDILSVVCVAHKRNNAWFDSTTRNVERFNSHADVEPCEEVGGIDPGQNDLFGL